MRFELNASRRNWNRPEVDQSRVPGIGEPGTDAFGLTSMPTSIRTRKQRGCLSPVRGRNLCSTTPEQIPELRQERYISFDCAAKIDWAIWPSHYKDSAPNGARTSWSPGLFYKNVAPTGAGDGRSRASRLHGGWRPILTVLLRRQRREVWIRVGILLPQSF
jgi:hypothetical protein